MKTLLTSLLLIFGISMNANAGILFEPYVGYESGTVAVDLSSGITGGGSVKGLGYGARLGYHFVMAWVALEYQGSSGQKYSPDGGGAEQDYAQDGTGVAVGVDIPMGLRVFGGYGMTYNGKLSFSDGTYNTYKGTYSKIGVGFKIIPKVALNIEYRMNKPTKVYDSTSGQDYDFTAVTPNISKFTHNPVFVSISVPL